MLLTAGPLEYTFEVDPTMCGSLMILDGAQNLIISYGYSVSNCELILTNWDAVRQART